MIFANPLWTPPRTPRAKPSARRDAAIIERLADAIAVVERLPPSPGTRALRTQLERYRHVVRGWVTLSPTEEQREALGEQLDEVLRRLAEGRVHWTCVVCLQPEPSRGDMPSGCSFARAGAVRA